MADAPKRVDFTRPAAWGHALHDLRTTSPGILSGMLHSREPLREGDEIVWRTEYGTAVGRLTMARCHFNPDDLYTVECIIVQRLGHDGEVLTDG